MPASLTGFFAAVMVGAVLSTFNSVLTSAATLFNQGVFKPLFRPDEDDRQQVRAGRVCSTVLAVAAILIAPSIDTGGSLYIYLQQINATFFGPMLAVILAGLLTRRATAKAALTGLMVGLIIFYFINFVFSAEVQALASILFGTTGDVHFLHFLCLVFVLTSLLLAAVSMIWPAPVRSWKMPSAPVDMTPWRFSKPMGAMISIATIACYVALAQ